MMVDEVKQNPIPVAPSCLCFKKDEFMLENFCVEKFISNHRKHVQLECLRDDLNVYLNVLKSAMIELINKDYADFVNLSSNLVGLDKAINLLSTPLGQLKEEVLGVKLIVDETIQVAEDKLSRKQTIREEKVKVQRLLSIHQKIEQIENALNISETSTSNSALDLNEEQVERLIVEAYHVNFDLSKSSDSPLSKELQPRIYRVTSILNSNLRDVFMESFNSGDIQSLTRCLRVYAAIDEIQCVELLVKEEIIEPLLDEIITDRNLKKNGLSFIYEEIISKVFTSCENLFKISSSSCKMDEYVPGYDFLTNAVWPEIVSQLESKIPSIFAPGNPNIFHKKYSESLKFVGKFEEHYTSIAQVNVYRNHQVSKDFWTKWNLLVYFQIRYQEIACALESNLQSSTINPCIDNTFKLQAVQTLYTCLDKAWSDEIYLQALCNKFWKLTLELLSRFNVWLKEIVSKQKNVLQTENKDDENSSKQTSVNGIEGKSGDHLLIQNVVLIICDIDNLVFKLNHFFQNVISTKLEAINVKSTSIFQESFNAILGEISSYSKLFEDVLMSSVVNDCKNHIKMVNDIPRLYRRTNKEIPHKPSAYVTNILKPLQLFLNSHPDTFLNSESSIARTMQWKTNVLEKVTDMYLSVTNEVLTSVKKTEDSLKRLKKARDRSNLPGGNNGNSNVMTDDDKIRLQLYLDVENYGHQISLFEVESSNIQNYISLLKLVESARNSSERR